jgi:hypothetical protein
MKIAVHCAIISLTPLTSISVMRFAAPNFPPSISQNQNNKNMNNELKNTIEKIIASKGAAIVSFDYNGKKRNGLIGFDSKKKGLGSRVWGQHLSSAIVEHDGKLFLSVQTNNEETESGHAFKSFDLSKIENFCHNSKK